MSKLSAMLSAVVLVCACGPGQGSTGVKTPDEIVAEQERLAEEDAKRADDYDSGVEAEETDSEKTGKWDKEGTELELKRATLSAETCPETLPDEQKKDSPKGTAQVTLTFSNDGHVKQSSISEPFADTPVGKCVLRAMGAIIVEVYEGPEETVTWEVDLTGSKKKKKKGEADESE
jgi:hypothetical protein